MAAVRAGIGLIWVLSLLTGRGIGYSVLPLPIPATSAEITAQTIAVPPAADNSLSRENDPAAEPKTDLFGNEVEDAVADYRVDPRGSIYERHSPETAVLFPKSPVL